MKVNMTPNPLDVVTIHASQGDTEARQWEFELHNNGELIDTSDVKEQLVFKAYKGGTEQILPENTSTPTTSPFIGDIRYPQGLLTGQEFTYRQSPTEEDGLAKITDIKGNTIVWNQLVDTNTISVTLTSGHKFITKIGGTYSLVNGTGQSLSVTGGTDEVFDLSLMFGTGNEPTAVDEFTSLFPLSYYPYNSGSLIPFMGNGIKTVRKNLMPFPYQDTRTTVTNVSITVNDDGSIKLNGTVSGGTFFFNLGNDSMNTINLFPNTYTMSTSLGKARLVAVRNGLYYATTDTGTGRATFTITEQCKMYFYITAPSGTVFNNETIYPQLEFGSSQTSYEPYTSSIFYLPISTYFPTGMKQAGDVYDELTPTKATTRMRGVDLGTLTFNQSPNFYYRQNSQDLGIKADAVVSFIAEDSNITSVYYYSNSGQFRVYVNDISIAPSGMLYYELETPTETSFTTASLVTENAEIPLSNNDGTLIGKCTEELSENPGFIDAKIKLSDSDGTCYSNKLQLHVERKPS